VTTTSEPFKGRRALVVTPVPTHPTTHGSRARVLSLIGFLTELGFDVHVAVFQREDRDEETMQAVFGDRLHLLPYVMPKRIESTMGRLGRWLRQLVSVDAKYTFSLDDWYDLRLDAPLRHLDQTIGFDLVVVEYVFASRALLSLPSARLKVIDTHDVFANRHRIFLAEGSKPQFYSTTPEDESRGLKRADLVLGIQAKETELFQGYGVNAITFGHTVKIDPLWGSATTQWDMLMVGSGNYMNVQGFLWFGREVMPLLLQAMPGVRVAVAGSVCNTTQDFSGITKLGVVDSLEELYACSRLAINPVRSGTGLNIKSVEALGYCMPLVATACGSRGLEAAYGKAIVVVETPEAFVQAIVALLSDTEEMARLSRGAQAFALDWNDAQTTAFTNALYEYLPV